MNTFSEMAEQWMRENMPSAQTLQTATAKVGMTDHDPSAWKEDFHHWALERCAWRDRCFGGIGALHTNFCEWALAHESVPCTLQTFERLLADAGFLFADDMVSGLILRG